MARQQKTSLDDLVNKRRSLILKNVEQYISLSDEGKALFVSLLEYKTIGKKQFLLRAGEVCSNQWFVLSGCLKVFYTDKEGIEHIIKFAPENWWAVDLESFALQTSAFYNIQAVEDAELVQISKSNHEKLLDQIPVFERFSRMMFQNSYIMLQHRMTQNLFSTAEEKYQHFQKKYPTLEGRIPQKDLASYLGITPEFLSMLRRKWTKTPIS